MNKTFTQDEILQMLRTSSSLARAQQLAQGVACILAATETHMNIGMLAFAHLLVDPLSRCISPTGPDGEIDISKKPVMAYDLPHEKILRDALQLYLAKQSAIVAAKDHGIDLLEAEATRAAPGHCLRCGTTISENKQKCKACVDLDMAEGATLAPEDSLQ